MRLRWLGAALAIALAIALSWDAGAPRPEAAVPPIAPHAARAKGGAGTAPAEPSSDPRADLLPPPPARDIFRYAEASPLASRPTRVEPEPLAMAAAPAKAPPPMVRFVGLVRRPEGLRAAVATPSGVVIIGPGDVVLGHTVLSLDEDRGLRLRAPDGTEQILAPSR